MAGTVAGRLDATAVQLGQALDDGQTETQTAARPLQALIRLGEHLKQVRQDLRVDADPRVAHFEHRFVARRGVNG